MKNFLYLASLVMLTLKLTNTSDISWLAVASPVILNIVMVVIAQTVVTYHKGKGTRIGRSLRERGIK